MYLEIMEQLLNRFQTRFAPCRQHFFFTANSDFAPLPCLGHLPFRLMPRLICALLYTGS